MKAKHFNILALIIVLAAITLLFAVIIVHTFDKKNEVFPIEPVVQIQSENSQGNNTVSQSPQGDMVVQLVQGQNISLPTTITGTATAWFFEGVFGVTLENSAHQVIARAQAHAIGNWATLNPVGFTVVLPITNYQGAAFVVFHKDNPSGNPQNDESFEVPVVIQ